MLNMFSIPLLANNDAFAIQFEDDDDIQDEPPKNADQQSFAASKLERIAMYKERYKYQPPAPYTNHTARDTLCGASPDYTTYFTDGTIKYRSRNSEDKTIYEIFFKENAENDISPIKGTVVEMGAHNGLQESNSHFYDICLGWETLLVEGNAILWEKLIANRPRTHRFSYAPSCSEEDELMNKTVKFDKTIWTNGGLADGSVTTAYTGNNITGTIDVPCGSEEDELMNKTVKFDKTIWTNGGLADGSVTTAYKGRPGTIDVPCGSLTKVLKDILNGHVSFFSLDVEGAEPAIVQNIDFDKVFIEIMMIETENNFCQRGTPCASRTAFRKTMEEEGYFMFENMIKASDVFIHPLSKHLNTAKRKGFKPSIG
eukprot:CAMPEP_0194124720 /NCGR_PEP_ID=MMETSP0150-20130528/59092_1 /TAXON_ID=122233 /ORGANISM="Chaetoceros debilis, Strain MM31A-1" /LENGTH=369 /DNA_ID=CAMNT_0038818501 /DNA_START=240 /DNA_END=1349 /DNA_ORIENTATION=-